MELSINGIMKFIVIVCIYLMKSSVSQEHGESLDLLIDRENISSIQEFLEKYVTLDDGGHPNASQLIDVWLTGQEGDKAVVAGKNEFAPPDLCLPREISVEIPKEFPGDAVKVFPPCTRVMRCGGCCNSPLQQCEPYETEILGLWVLQTVLPYPGAPAYQRPSITRVEVERHTSCACKCRIKQENCTPMQEYFQQICACLCINRKDARKCPTYKPWDSSSCSCRCPERERTVCEDDMIYSEDSCSCTLKVVVSGTVDPVILRGGGDSDETNSGEIDIEVNEIDNPSSRRTTITTLDNSTTTTIASSPTETTTSPTSVISSSPTTTTAASTTRTTTRTTSTPTTTATTPKRPVTVFKPECIPKRPCPPRWIPKLFRSGACNCMPPLRKGRGTRG